MRLALVGVVAGVALVVTGCGGSSAAKDRRAAVNAYFDQVDRAEQRLLASTGQIDRTFGAFSVTHITPSELQQLAFAQETIGEALRKVRAIKPPPDARRIHPDLVRLLALQYRVAHELHSTADYLPRFSQALAPLPDAGRTLGQDISAATATPLKPAVSPSSGGGAAIWARAGCGSCHSLAVAGATGSAGPSLDQLHPTADAVAAQVRSGGPGMPSFRGTLSPAEISQLASWVATSETVPKTTKEVLNAFGAAFTRYGGSLQLTLDALDRLDSPPVLRPTHAAERRLLSRAVALCATIASELGKQNVDGANAAIKQLFITVATGVGAAQDRRAAAAAVRAYNAQLAEIATLTAQVAHERGLLVSKIG